ncbi:molecular chaperone DnaK [Candidatus Gottesmanbacteria bacterium CG11_big_fil_rev_8_21_14_0_20_37_11]|uniref:Chaperone protein DnaK n=3 Tax=Candidatus Gottesmaniibacteriota TaxID=1752720 RepID=A0A2M7RSC7_9BACT|nr:MAG: molecular chaperone DnaK [Candidatus Gottesmanbacteria bacterium CG1_02_37_22]PIP32671.1 MAG: molecular chaperone DnaK [Candidatus Gottesmanbacteria bacterium CG23_combo_of_CG06-09_8_20_14_all_37_19]PIR08550.1 MAG: molecular chaperone DnaK [Candidatus Gottesmanbacteria bacterium CG11_big_fil_rev_8_21_14_0_20_37_11]PIZ03202.1 MAG: molecular chaperone DnaK [Candidatus Gottesmanbacteria bacterium CG_4_10_14_0_8_um_filter_37_24]
MAKVIGIDLGTTNSAVAVMEGGSPKIIYSSEGRNVIPSIVDPIKHIIGDVAKRQMVVNPKSTVFSVKRLMGRKYNDKSVQKDTEWLPYTIKSGREGMAVIEIGGKTFTPQEISAMILQKIKADAEAYLGGKITEAVITVPAYFDDSQRQATKQAGEIAGLTVKRILNEPTAASLAYGLDKKHAHTVAVYDLGGGTFDISILELGEGVYEVKSTNGDTHLGGDDFDRRIMDYFADDFKKEHGVDLRKDPQALQRLKDSAEKAKIELSSSLETEINLPFITQGKDGPLHMVFKLTRAKLENIVSDLIESTIKPVEAALKDAKMTKDKIDEIVMVGGMTRMPRVFQLVKEFFGKEPNRTVNPDEVVAIGAAVQAGVLTGEVKDVVLLDVTPLTLGVETLGGVMTPLIKRNTTVPTSKSEIFSTAADNQTSVEINILQGERPMAGDNKSLGRFILDGIPPAPRGVPQVEVSFDIDANGILNVSAKDKATGKTQSIKIMGSTGLSKDEIDKMTKEADEHAADDTSKKEKIEAKNKADNLIYVAEKSLKDAGDKVPADIKKEVEEKIAAVKTLTDASTKDEIEEKTKDLSETLQKIGQSMYQQQQQQKQGEDEPPVEEKPEKEKEEKNNDKKNKGSKKENVQEGEVVDS